MSLALSVLSCNIIASHLKDAKRSQGGDTQTIFCISHIVMYCQTSLFLYVLPSYKETDLLSPGTDVGK